jgi:hypothetical protein
MKKTIHLGLFLNVVCFASWPSAVRAQEAPPVPENPPPGGPPPSSAVAVPSQPAQPLPPAVTENQRKDAEAEGSASTRGDGDEFGAGDPWKSAPAMFEALGLSFRLLLQTRYRHTFGAESENPDELYRIPEDTLARDGDGWDINRAFVGISAAPSKYLGLKMVFDLAELRHDKIKKVPKQVYATLRPLPKKLEFLAGILKLPYSTEELDSTARYELTSLGEANALASDLGFAGRDIGAEVVVSPLRKPRYLKVTAGVFRGQANDENASPIGAIAARAQTEPLKGLRFGASWVMHPETVVELNAFDTSGKDRLPNPEDPNFPRARRWQKGHAFAGDVTFNRWGLMLRGEGLMGDRVDYDTRYGAEKWAAVWGLAAYKFDVGPLKLEPALRAEWLDTDLDRNAGVFLQLTAGVGVHFSRSAKLVLDVTRLDVEDDTPVPDQPLPLREVPYDALGSTRATVQLQVAL